MFQTFRLQNVLNHRQSKSGALSGKACGLSRTFASECSWVLLMSCSTKKCYECLL